MTHFYLFYLPFCQNIKRLRRTQRDYTGPTKCSNLFRGSDIIVAGYFSLDKFWSFISFAYPSEITSVRVAINVFFMKTINHFQLRNEKCDRRHDIADAQTHTQCNLWNKNEIEISFPWWNGEKKLSNVRGFSFSFCLLLFCVWFTCVNYRLVHTNTLIFYNSNMCSLSCAAFDHIYRYNVYFTVAVGCLRRTD